LGIFNVRTLPRLCAPADQDNQPVAIAAKIDTLARTVVDTSLGHAATHGLLITEVTVLHPIKGRRDFRGGSVIETFKPLHERAMPIVPDIFNQFIHYLS
jgi:hypothetical protein